MSRLLLLLCALAALAGCRVFELGSVISCAEDAQCPQRFRCSDGRCVTPTGDAPAPAEGEGEGEGEGEPQCADRADCDAVPGCVDCACDDGRCVAACVAGSCGEGAVCLDDGLCRAECDGHGDCPAEQACLFVDDGSLFGTTLCFDGCRDDSGCDAGQVCDFFATCVPGQANSRGRYQSCVAPSECVGALKCTGTRAGATTCQQPCDVSTCTDCCPVGDTCSFFDELCVERCDGCVGESCCRMEGYFCEEGDIECKRF